MSAPLRLTDEEFDARLREFRAQAEFLKAEADGRGLLRCAAALAVAFEQARESVEFSVPSWMYFRPDGSVAVCAWCQRDKGVTPLPNQSHGICPRHKEAMMAQARALARGQTQYPINYPSPQLVGTTN